MTKAARGTALRWARMMLLPAVLVIGPFVPTVAVAQHSAAVYEFGDLERLQNTFAHLADKVRPTVVSISTSRLIRPGGSREVAVPNSQGSGFIYRSNGYIATNHHVIENADRIKVTLSSGNPRSFEAQVVQVDPRSDLAVIKIDAQGLQVATLADIGEVRQGHWAFTVGNPFGLANESGNTSFSYGVVAALGQSLTGYIESTDNDRYYGNLIQTDASINPGNSGGPLFNIHGRVVGVCTAMVTSSGVDEGSGFAIPMSSRTRGILESLADGKPVRYGFLGVQIAGLSPREARERALPDGRGVLIRGLPGGSVASPAAQAGLRVDDVITGFDGVEIEDSDQLIRLVGATPVGSAVEVIYYRDKRRRTTRVVLAERAETASARTNPPASRDGLRYMNWMGALLVEPTESFLASRGLPLEKPGLYIVELAPDSPLRRHGLEADTFIVRMNGRRVRTLEDFRAQDGNDHRPWRVDIHDGGTVTIP